MLPLIQPGDQVLVAHGSDNLRRGDIIVFLQGEKMIAHRLLRIHNDKTGVTFITKGDNTSYLDSPLATQQVVGRVLKIKRGDRWVAVDTWTWRRGGWLIATTMLGWTTLYGWGRRLMLRLWGNRPHYLADAIQKGIGHLSRFLLKVIILMTTFRWKAVTTYNITVHNEILTLSSQRPGQDITPDQFF